MLCFGLIKYFDNIIYFYLYIRPLCVLSDDGYVSHPVRKVGLYLIWMSSEVRWEYKVFHDFRA